LKSVKICGIGKIVSHLYDYCVLGWIILFIYLLQGGSANLSEDLEHDYKGWLGLGELIDLGRNYLPHR
jgi:hypothetical protein